MENYFVTWRYSRLFCRVFKTTELALRLFRNNLTVMEIVSLYGRGGKSELRIGSRAPSSLHPLLFEIKEAHLKECENIKSLFVLLRYIFLSCTDIESI